MTKIHFRFWTQVKTLWGRTEMQLLTFTFRGGHVHLSMLYLWVKIPVLWSLEWHVYMCMSVWLQTRWQQWLCTLPTGLVQSRSGVCLGWVLRSLWCSGLSSAFMLPERSAREGREWSHDWPHPAALQLRLLCLPCPWKQVQIKLLTCLRLFPHRYKLPLDAKM